jgi:hypothetical protein
VILILKNRLVCDINIYIENDENDSIFSGIWDDDDNLYIYNYG